MRPLYACAVACLATVYACGGSGSDAPPPPPPPVTVLQGSWLGVAEDLQGQSDTVRVDIDGSGRVTDVVVSGASAGLTGVMQLVRGNAYRMVMSDGTKVCFFADPSLTYATFVDDGDTIGILQRGAVALPTYANSDLRNATWAGQSFFIDINYEYDSQLASMAVVAPDGSFTATEGTQNFVSAPGAEMTLTDPATGRFVGGFDVMPGVGLVQLYVSADKQFVGGIAYGGGTYPVDGSLFVWLRQ